MFNNVLIANRGEIAVRIARSVRDAGLQCIAVFSDADRDARHVAAADRAVALGGSSAAESYLNIDKLLDAARRTGAEAIHPGYGFLSENAEFARACSASGIVFIGPSADVIELMGNKRAAKIAVEQAGVACIPGYQGSRPSNAELLAAADSVGYPLMVKAAAGGGGRGMRRVNDATDLAAAIDSARREANSAFANDELILEKLIVHGRHIEFQIAADGFGNVVHLGERDCSLQRRHQKVIEEAPSPAVDEAMRSAMGEAAVRVAKACGYQGVGTVEFMVGGDGSFSFLEMNTRLQVEHPVTELVTGIDLVDWQLIIAAGKPLPASQDDIRIDGHAIEARLYTEDPAMGFVPQTGEILAWRPASGAGVRVDHGLRQGDQVSSYYDPMVAKIIAHGDSREQARRRLIQALETTTLLGVVTNQFFLRQLLLDTVFVEGAATTSHIDEVLSETLIEAEACSGAEIALAGALLLRLIDPQPAQWQHWSNSAGMIKRRVVNIADADIPVAIEADGSGYRVTVADVEYHIEALELDGVTADCTIDAVRCQVPYAFRDGTVFAQLGARQLVAADVTYRPLSAVASSASGQIVAATEGQVIGLAVTCGDRVSKGQTLVVVEAMKMEHRHLADGDGVVTAIHTSQDMQVKKGQLLVELELEAEAT
ncbi:MAG: ATP-grasp domain-containing protein [Gammaproteobacteria bacterium]|nr:ATP-grasp domain-containing protein [Gammaproteobacteria bacterium]